jgi:hypothetical protein
MLLPATATAPSTSPSTSASSPGYASFARSVHARPYAPATKAYGLVRRWTDTVQSRWYIAPRCECASWVVKTSVYSPVLSQDHTGRGRKHSRTWDQPPLQGKQPSIPRCACSNQLPRQSIWCLRGRSHLHTLCPWPDPSCRICLCHLGSVCII